MDINDELNGNLDSNSNNGGMYTPPGKLPNATATLVLGIISIVGCILYGIPGLICGIIALVMHKKDKVTYLSNPTRFQQSYQQAKAGYVCAIIGTILSSLYVLFFIIVLIMAAAGSRF